MVSGPVAAHRQAPNLRNVQFNVPLGWDGRFGGVLGNQASIITAIENAASHAIDSPVEMVGHVDPTVPADQNKLAALAAFLLSRSPTEPPANPPAPPADQDPNDTDTAALLASIQTGADVFFGRSASAAGLLQAGKACVSCHPPPFFTDNKIRTNILNPAAAFDYGYANGPGDPGAGLVTVTDSTTGKSVQVGTFKTPSLHRFYPDGQPAFHSGVFGQDDELFNFYQKSLGFTLAAGEATGLHDWLVNCPRGPNRNPALIPLTCK